MAGARIRVVEGPDEGLEITLGSAEVRIGRGAAANVALTDQNVMGALRVWFDGTQYMASNHIESTTGTPAELRAETEDGGDFVLEPRGSGPWFAGFRIWLTGQTCLVLTTEPDLVVTDGKFEVSRGKSSKAAKKQKDRLTLLAILILFPAAAFVFLQEPGQQASDRSEQESGDQYRRVEGRLRKAHEEVRNDRAARPAGVVLGLLRDARFAEVSGRRGEAAERYVAAREELNRVLGAPDAVPPTVAGSADLAAALAEAREYVADRLVVHKSFVVRDRPGR